MIAGLRIRHLTFVGPSKPAATLEFDEGLTVIWGASETGKSFLVDTIDYMLGGRGPLRDFDERVGYDRILLAMETSAGEQFTIHRSTQGGSFLIFDGLHTSMPTSEGKEYAEQHSDKNDQNLSSFLLEKVGLKGARLRRNKKGLTQSLSFRNLARLMIVNEEEIIQQRSPLSDGNGYADTANASVFKLLLTGVDDSALGTSSTVPPEETSREAQVELLDQLIRELQHQVRELAGPPAELETQLDRLDSTLNRHMQQLAVSEGQYREVAANRRDRLKKLEEASNRLTEVRSLVARFKLLDKHYTSDLQRLRGIEEAGNLFAAFGTGDCPMCGAPPSAHKAADACEGDVADIIAAAKAESAKIELRQEELTVTVAGLVKEEKSFVRRIPKIENELREYSQEIETIVAPKLRELRADYGKLSDKKVEVREALGLYRSLKELEDRKKKLLAEEGADGALANVDVELSTATVDKFAALVLRILQKWDFPDAERVHFDLKVRDLIINGKSRASYGKGLRALTQAAFSVALLEFCRENQTPHPGIVILDSPLLSYREPETSDQDASDDLRGTTVNANFYNYLLSIKTDRQIIIVENTDPPPAVQQSPHAIRFTGNASLGRAGFFPPKPEATNGIATEKKS